MITNTDPVTGIAYGYVAANDLDGDVVQELMYGRQANNISEDRARDDELDSLQRAWRHECDELAERCAEDGTDYVPPEEPTEDDVSIDAIEEPEVSGTYEGVEYCSSWLGGALNFWIFKSPLITTKAGQGSPCVPGAGILKNPADRGGDVMAYDVPPDWWFVDSTLPDLWASMQEDL